MLAGQGLQLLASVLGELEVHAAVVDWVALAQDQPGGLGALGELDGAVVAYVQLLGGLADRRPGVVGWPRMTSSSW